MAAALRAIPLHPSDRRRLQEASLGRAAAATAAIEKACGGATATAGGPAGESRRRARYGRGGALADNCAAAIRLTGGRAHSAADAGTAPPIAADLLLEAHHLLAGGPGGRADWGAGRYRTERCVRPAGAPGAGEVPGLVDGLLAWLSQDLAQGTGESRFGRAVVRALAAHAHLLAISPFRGGNGVAARVLEGYVLAGEGCPALASHLLAEFYLRTVDEYESRLDRRRRDRSLTSFVEYAVAGLRDGLRELVSEVADGALRSSWRCFVRERLAANASRKRSVLARRRRLMLALPLRSSLKLDELASLNADVAGVYAGLSRRTLRRDAAFLAGAGLLAKRDGGWAANTSALRPDSPA